MATREFDESDGFCGYDWMVDSIIRYGEIINESERLARVRQQVELKRRAEVGSASK